MNTISSPLRGWVGVLMASTALFVSPMAMSYTIDATATSTNPITGLWWNADESGWGTAIIQQYGTIFITLYTYDGSGNPTWYVASNCPVVADGCTGPLYKVTGGSMPTVTWNPNTVVTTSGSVTLAFTDENTGTMSYVIDTMAGSKAIARQVFATAPVTPPSTGYNYAALNGTYSCNLFSGTPYQLQSTFSATQLTAALTVDSTILRTNTYMDKVGFLSGYPYYSRNLALSSNAETVFFLNGQYTIVTGPASDVPDLLLQRPTSKTSCSKD